MSSTEGQQGPDQQKPVAAEGAQPPAVPPGQAVGPTPPSGNPQAGQGYPQQVWVPQYPQQQHYPHQGQYGYGPGQFGPAQYGQQYGPPAYGPQWGPGMQQQPPKRKKRLPMVIGALGLAAVVAAGSVAWGIDQQSNANSSSTMAQVLSPSAVADKVSPGLVNINTVLGYQGAKAAGTGIVLTADGEILTNHHVIEGATEISVVDVGNGKTYSASVVGYDAEQDIAVLKLKDASGLETAKIGDSSKVKVGDQVVGIGNAGGKGGTPSFAPGEVTALDQAITATDESGANPENLKGLIQTDANIQPGDSGGPLANSAGEVIGVDTAGGTSNPGNGGAGQTGYNPNVNNSKTPSTAIAALTADGYGTGNGTGNGYGDGSGFGDGQGFGDGNGQGQGQGEPGQGEGNGESQGQGQGSQSPTGYAVPINEAMQVVQQIDSGKESGDVHLGGSPMLGVSILSNANGTAGAVVNDVIADGKADEAGMKAGDVITSFGGKKVDSPEALSTLLDQHHPGDKVSVSWTDQSGQQHTKTIELITGPVR